MDFFEKLYIVRTLLSLNQKEAAEKAGINPVTIGVLERGEKNTMPEAYATFLYKNGIDLNWVFNKDNKDEHVFRTQENNSLSSEKVSNVEVDKNVIINQELLEAKHLTYTLIKQLEKLHDELLEIKKINKILNIRSKESNQN
jgi:transcriptional regulator with XRE-family HTH domain